MATESPEPAPSDREQALESELADAQGVIAQQQDSEVHLRQRLDDAERQRLRLSQRLQRAETLLAHRQTQEEDARRQLLDAQTLLRHREAECHRLQTRVGSLENTVQRLSLHGVAEIGGVPVHGTRWGIDEATGS